MRLWFVLLLGSLLSGQCISSDDAFKKLEACGVSLFSFWMTRLQQQIEDFSACKQFNDGNSDPNCRGSIESATIDLQQAFSDYGECIRDIR
uniref:Putative salivary protein hyp12 n=1 Tax=Anopheles stephensi TaxID=30069 RepID=Q8I6R1_ANOST|nr:putative salivary protein hyp12 [Anopheles stephensi]